MRLLVEISKLDFQIERHRFGPSENGATRNAYSRDHRFCV